MRSPSVVPWEPNGIAGSKVASLRRLGAGRKTSGMGMLVALGITLPVLVQLNEVVAGRLLVSIGLDPWRNRPHA